MCISTALTAIYVSGVMNRLSNHLKEHKIMPVLKNKKKDVLPLMSSMKPLSGKQKSDKGQKCLDRSSSRKM